MLRVVARHGQTLGLGQRFLKLGGEFVQTHVSTPVTPGLDKLGLIALGDGAGLMRSSPKRHQTLRQIKLIPPRRRRLRALAQFEAWPRSLCCALFAWPHTTTDRLHPRSAPGCHQGGGMPPPR